MDLNKDILNPILLFLQKFLGSHLWILPLAVAIASWIMWKYYKLSLWLLYIAIIFSIITIFFLGVRLYLYLSHIYEKRQNIKKAKQAKERQVQEEASYIWKYVAHINRDIISVASYLLELEPHDGNQYLRFIKKPMRNNCDEQKIIDYLIKAVYSFSIPNNYNSSTYNLIKVENISDGIYFAINPYLYSLLKQYKETHTWKKI